MVMPERDEADEQPGGIVNDPVGAAIAQLIAVVFDALPDCPERISPA